MMTPEVVAMFVTCLVMPYTFHMNQISNMNGFVLSRKILLRKQMLHHVCQKAETLVGQMIPKRIYQRLCTDTEFIADQYPEVRCHLDTDNM